ncbi:hypothetical protein [Herbidospora sp. NBRC 101105]|uniref:hypothetical protein n=1 Tax=Herbidospora sp. NBRC 101105 TaxID=3032195 RepID=UPI0024A02A98|nr:hypothetical protein [Herbidospora sp. NBRC 101105]GLX99449.1 hypothetical protein Hesp01_73990 [Herbidospora sp. NBRC 101105]
MKAREIATRTALIGMGVFTAVPVLAVFQPEQLGSYGISDPEPMVLTLLQHRGVFQFLAGIALVWSAFRQDVRVPVAVGVIVSKSSAVALTITRPDAQALLNPFIQAFDIACVLVLAAIVAQTAVARRGSTRGRTRVTEAAA